MTDYPSLATIQKIKSEQLWDLVAKVLTEISKLYNKTERVYHKDELIEL